MKKFTSAERLKQIMELRNLKQVEILNLSLPHQERLGIQLTKSHLSNYISGRSNPNQNSLYLLAQTLDVSVGWLMGYDDVDMELDKNAEHFGVKIKKHRELLGLTQKELAKKAKVHDTRIGSIEEGGLSNIEELTKIAKALGILPSELYTHFQMARIRDRDYTLLFTLLRNMNFEPEELLHNETEGNWNADLLLLKVHDKETGKMFMMSTVEMNMLTSKVERYFDFELQNLLVEKT